MLMCMSYATFRPFFHAASAKLVMRTKFDEKHDAAIAPCESSLPTSSIRLLRTSASDPEAPYKSVYIVYINMHSATHLDKCVC